MTTDKNYGLLELQKDYGKLTFAEALESYRRGEGWSQTEFAARLRISTSSLCDLEKGRRIPSPKRATYIAKKLKEPIAFWVQLALQDALEREKIKLKVSVASL